MEIQIQDDFDLDKIAQSGQCFRWQKAGENACRIVHKGQCLTIREHGGGRYHLSCSEDSYHEYWRSYFDLDEDYRRIRTRIALADDPFLHAACAYGKGIRILRQDPWETLVSFIIVNANLKLSIFAETKCHFSAVGIVVYTALFNNITCRHEACQALIYQLVLGLTGDNGKYNYSKAVHVYPPFSDITCSAKNYKIALALTIISQNKNIPSIKDCIAKLCAAAGEHMTDNMGEPYIAFPTPEAILGLSEEQLRACRLGYRWKYVRSAALAVAEGVLDLFALMSAEEEETLSRFMSVPGVGVKVANCVSLFGLHHLDAFPEDVWIKRILANEYPAGYPMERYRPYNGVYQQYMFFYYRGCSAVSKQ